jgi:hypothetical protein
VNEHLIVAVAMLAPIAVVIARDRSARALLTTIATVAATWLVATFALSWLVGDPSDLYAFYLMFLVVVPAISVPVAALVATRVAGVRGQLISSLVLGVLGWALGVIVLFAIERRGVACQRPGDVWIYAELLALPASYAAIGAIVAGRLGRSPP